MGLQWKSYFVVLVASLMAVTALDIDATDAIAAKGAFDGLNDALNQANDGDVIHFYKGFALSRRILINKKITLDGHGNYIREVGEFNLFLISADGVTMKNILFQGSLSSKFREFIKPQAFDFTLEDCIFSGGAGGMRTLGRPPRGLRVHNNVFNGVTSGVSFNRDVYRVPGPEAERTAEALNGGRFVIQENTFGGRHRVGVTIDCGNDGSDGDRRMPMPDHPLRETVRNKTTSFLGTQFRSIVSKNKMSKTEQFGMAFALTAEIDVNENIASIADLRGDVYRQAVHIERSAQRMGVYNNILSVNGGSDELGAGVSLVTFTDYGNESSKDNGIKDAEIAGNTFYGDKSRGITGFGFDNINIYGNNVEDLVRNNAKPYFFYTVPGGPNTFGPKVQNNVPIDPQL